MKKLIPLLFLFLVSCGAPRSSRIGHEPLITLNGNEEGVVCATRLYDENGSAINDGDALLDGPKYDENLSRYKATELRNGVFDLTVSYRNQNFEVSAFYGFLTDFPAPMPMPQSTKGWVLAQRPIFHYFKTTEEADLFNNRFEVDLTLLEFEYSYLTLGISFEADDYGTFEKVFYAKL